MNRSAFLGLFALTFMTLFGCGPGVASIGGNTRCFYDEECGGGYCASDGRCYAASGCRSSADCAPNYVCSSDGVCDQLTGCSFDSECGGNDYCASDGACYPVPGCFSSDECPDGAYCASDGACYYAPGF